MALFRQELAIDLGTANTVIFKDGDVVLDEPSIIATDTKSGKLMALGNHAQLMEEQRRWQTFRRRICSNCPYRKPIIITLL